jgi:hypothetical protein
VPTVKRSPDELARQGQDIFDRLVRPQLRGEDEGKFVAIDVDSGDFEINTDDYSAVTRLRGRRPTGDVWLIRVGSPTTYRMGGAR